MQSITEKRLPGSTAVRAATTVYLAMLCLFLLASFFPDNRIWGFNWWAYYPLYVRLGLLAVGVLMPIAARYLLKDRSLGSSGAPGRTYLFTAIAIIAVFGLLYWLLRARTHFLGDGYLQLSLLTSADVFIKPTNYGGTILQVLLTKLFGDYSEAGVLLSYQVVAVLAGTGFLIAAALSARALFKRNRDRLLFLLGTASAGYMLMFFGYVENYALFVMSVAVFSLVGLLISLGKVSRFWILPVPALAIFFHVFGVVLIPGALYLLVANTRTGNRLAALSSELKWVMVLVVIIAGVAVFYRYYTADYFFRFSLVPVVQDQFTVEGYTLCSFKHVVDYLNLLVLLMPGLPVVIAALFAMPVRRVVRRYEYRFLLVLLVSSLGAAFMFNPKLGMPRDWDLFSFCGIPLAVSCFYLLLDERLTLKNRQYVVILTVLLGFLVLVPRAVSQAVPDISVAHFKHYLRLDRVKGRTGRQLLINYYTRQGDLVSGEREARRRERDFPERALMRQARAYYEQANYEAVIMASRKALEYNPVFSDAYSYLGTSYTNLGQFENAQRYLGIALGFNPYDAVSIHNLGTALLKKGELDRAEQLFNRALDIDSSLFHVHYGLANLYSQRNELATSFQHLQKLVGRKDVPHEYFLKQARRYWQRGDFGKARFSLDQALVYGLDSIVFLDLLRKYPKLDK